MSTIDAVQNFWEKNPLWVGESQFSAGTLEFFEEHRKIVIEDCMAGKLDPRFLPSEKQKRRVLDLGCGPGFWTVELARQGCKEIVSADLTQRALSLTEQRCRLLGLPCNTSQQNAEKMTFPSKSFSHVNCQGVIHHTPDTMACIREIHRVLEKDGTASLSVYHKNVVLRGWPLLQWPAKLMSRWMPKLKGRGRESIAETSDANEIVRLYDGRDNPLGKAYTKKEFYKMLAPYFEVTDCFFHLFPARAFPFQLPSGVHRWLDRNLGFMMVVVLRKIDSSR